MPTLKIGTQIFEASNGRVVREADRMFKLSPERRAHRLEKAKTELARAADAKGSKNMEALPATKRAAAKDLCTHAGPPRHHLVRSPWISTVTNIIERSIEPSTS